VRRADAGPQTLWRIKTDVNVVPVPHPVRKSKVPPFSMYGGPAIAANSRDGSRLLRFWVKVPNTSSEIGTTLSRARACGRRKRFGGRMVPGKPRQIAGSYKVIAISVPRARCRRLTCANQGLERFPV
jgi:hypothetical protein